LLPIPRRITSEIRPSWLPRVSRAKLANESEEARLCANVFRIFRSPINRRVLAARRSREINLLDNIRRRLADFPKTLIAYSASLIDI
jgi:hypothetical protein